MAKSNLAKKEELEKITMRLWEISGSLAGLSSLFQVQSSHASLESDELFGIGQLLKVLSNEVRAIEDILNSKDK